MKQTPIRWLIKQAKPYRWLNGLTILFGLISGLATIGIAGLIAYIIDAAFLDHASINHVLKPLAWLSGLFFSRALCFWLKEISAVRLSVLVRTDIRTKALMQLNALGPVTCRDYKTGDLVTLLLEQIESLDEFYRYYLAQMILSVGIPLSILGVVFYLNWLSGVILLVCAPLMPFFMALVGMGAKSANQKNFQALARMSVYFLDILQGLGTLKLYNRSKAQIHQVKTSSDDYRKETMRVLRIAFLSSAVLEFFSALSIALIAVFLGLGLLGHVHIGSSLTLFTALWILLLAPEFFLPLRELGVHYHARAQAVAAAESIIDLLNRKTCDDVISINTIDKPKCICMNDVIYQYASENKKLFNGLSFSIDTQQVYYLVGESGSGKTTLMNMLMGFIKPDSGSITINNKNLHELTIAEWRKQIAWLGQTPKLFYGSIKDNLLMANSNASLEDIKHALRLAYIDEFVFNLPNGLETLIDEKNLTLSGGQIQRLGLARVFLQQAPILLLDEPFASLDEVSRYHVLEAINAYSKNKIVFIATHQLLMIPNDAFVIVLDEGRCDAVGRVQEVMRSSKQFQLMFELEA